MGLSKLRLDGFPLSHSEGHFEGVTFMEPVKSGEPHMQQEERPANVSESARDVTGIMVGSE